ncbi:MAG: hypothetical protein ACRDQA_11910 [Nocardioidaceae bacterium]
MSDLLDKVTPVLAELDDDYLHGNPLHSTAHDDEPGVRIDPAYPSREGSPAWYTWAGAVDVHMFNAGFASEVIDDWADNGDSTLTKHVQIRGLRGPVDF